MANGICGAASYLCSAQYLVTHDLDLLWWAFYLLPLSFFFDAVDGKIARWQGGGQGSPLGQELDSLADLISFSVAPSMLAFAVGMRTWVDCAMLVFFVACGISRLARYNATVQLLSNASGKITFFEGTPVPTTLALSSMVAWLMHRGRILDKLPFGVMTLASYKYVSILWTNARRFHPLTLLYLASGIAQISKNLRIPKPFN